MPKKPESSGSEQAAHTMQCMEVWGGNRAIDNGVAMAGLDAWVYSTPFEGNEAGGDVHYVSSCATGRITRLMVADVAGHGSAVDQLALGLRSLLRRYVNFYDQSSFVQRLNADFESMSEGCKFATAIIATYWGPTGKVTICNAGHPPPLIYRARTKQWSLLQPDSDADRSKRKGSAAETDEGPSNIPLGIDTEAIYPDFEFNFRAGDMLLIYTDSLSEAMDESSNLLGEQGLLEIVRTMDVAAPESFSHTLVEKVADYRAGKPADDDITIMLIRNNGIGMKKMNLITGLVAGWRVFAASAGAIARGGKDRPIPEFTLTNIFGAFSNKLNEKIRAKE